MSSGKYGNISGAKDLSDWGRPIARFFANILKETKISVLMVTNFHLLLSIFCAWLILQEYIIEGCILLVIKGVVDAIDGELARIRERPSHVGRYWDTIADTLGLILVTYAFGQYLGWTGVYISGIVVAVLFQYSLFNHFSVRARGLGLGDDTSRIDEKVCPVAKPWEKQIHVNFLHKIYLVGFSWQDQIINLTTGKGSKNLSFELTVSSILGYGFQSIIILILGLSSNIDLLDDLILYVNSSLMILVILRSYF
jgi:phosphatidylglycerophosphate synthase